MSINILLINAKLQNKKKIFIYGITVLEYKKKMKNNIIMYYTLLVNYEKIK